MSLESLIEDFVSRNQPTKAKTVFQYARKLPQFTGISKKDVNRTLYKTPIYEHDHEQPPNFWLKGRAPQTRQQHRNHSNHQNLIMSGPHETFAKQISEEGRQLIFEPSQPTRSHAQLPQFEQYQQQHDQYSQPVPQSQSQYGQYHQPVPQSQSQSQYGQYHQPVPQSQSQSQYGQYHQPVPQSQSHYGQYHQPRRSSIPHQSRGYSSFFPDNTHENASPPSQSQSPSLTATPRLPSSRSATQQEMDKFKGITQDDGGYGDLQGSNPTGRPKNLQHCDDSFPVPPPFSSRQHERPPKPTQASPPARLEDDVLDAVRQIGHPCPSQQIMRYLKDKQLYDQKGGQKPIRQALQKLVKEGYVMRDESSGIPLYRNSFQTETLDITLEKLVKKFNGQVRFSESRWQDTRSGDRYEVDCIVTIFGRTVSHRSECSVSPEQARIDVAGKALQHLQSHQDVALSHAAKDAFYTAISNSAGWGFGSTFPSDEKDFIEFKGAVMVKEDWNVANAFTALNRNAEYFLQCMNTLIDSFESNHSNPLPLQLPHPKLYLGITDDRKIHGFCIEDYVNSDHHINPEDAAQLLEKKFTQALYQKLRVLCTEEEIQWHDAITSKSHLFFHNELPYVVMEVSMDPGKVIKSRRRTGYLSAKGSQTARRNGPSKQSYKREKRSKHHSYY